MQFRLGALSDKLDRAGLVGAPIMIKARPLKGHFEVCLKSQLPAAPLFLTSRGRIALVVVLLFTCVLYRCFLCFSFVVCQDHKLTCRMEAGFGQEHNSHRLLLALLLSCGKGLNQAVEY